MRSCLRENTFCKICIQPLFHQNVERSNQCISVDLAIQERIHFLLHRTKILVCMYVNHEIPRILTKLSFLPYLCVKVGFPDVDPEMERSQKGFWVDKTFLPFAPCPQSERLLWPLLTLSPTFYQLLLFYPALTLI